MAMKLPPALQQLIDSFQILPGVGPKSAQRMALYLLEKDRLGAERLSHSLQQAMNKLDRCQSCRNYAESELCPICSDTQRSTESLVSILKANILCCMAIYPLLMALVRQSLVWLT